MRGASVGPDRSPLRRHAVYETTAMLDALARDGAAWVSQALLPEQCTRARDAVDALSALPWDEVHDGPPEAATHRGLDRFLCVFNRDAFWLPFLDRPGIVDLAEAVLGADCHVIGQTAWRTHPGYRSEPLHADYDPWPSHACAGAVPPAFILTAQFYLNDVTPDLAPTRFVPGSHRSMHAHDESAAITVLARAGDCLIFRSDLVHAGGDNRSAGQMRYALQVHYGRREMAQHFPRFLEWQFDPRVIAAATPRQRRLLGEHAPGAYD